MSFPFSQSRLYGICDEETCMRFQIESLRFADSFFSAGGNLLQYRNKVGSKEDYLQTGLAIARLANSYLDIVLVFNEHYEAVIDAMRLEFSCGIKYMLHFGQEDLKKHHLLVEFCKKKKISFGISTHNEQEFLNALVYHPSYIAIGAMFASITKPDVEVALFDVEKMINSTNLPIVYIGGVTLSNVHQLYFKAGFRFAVISDIFCYGVSSDGIQKYLSCCSSYFYSKTEI